MMKLKKLLKHISIIQKIQIIDYSDGDEEILFEGCTCDTPWQLAKMYLDTDSVGEAIGSIVKDDEVIITIYVREEKHRRGRLVCGL